MQDQSIVTIVSFLVTLGVLVTPLFKLNSSITKLNITMDNVNKALNCIETDNRVRDEKLSDHEIRIDRLEHK